MEVKEYELKEGDEWKRNDFVDATIKLFGGDDKTVTKKVKNKETKIAISKLKGQGFSPLCENKNGILVIGLNPAGDLETAKKEDIKKNPDFFPLYHINSKNITNKNLLNDRSWEYFNGIQKVMDIVFDKKAKWDWCNLDWNECVKGKLSNDGWEAKDVEQIKNYFDEYSDATNTIYIADLFYLHETSSSQFMDWLKERQIEEADLNTYIKNMLQNHIGVLIKKGIAIKFIYINNSKASKNICKALGIKDKPSVVSLKYGNLKIPMFFGCMLTGQNAMDCFSRSRLINEIKDVCAKQDIKL